MDWKKSLEESKRPYSTIRILRVGIYFFSDQTLHTYLKRCNLLPHDLLIMNM